MSRYHHSRSNRYHTIMMGSRRSKLFLNQLHRRIRLSTQMSLSLTNLGLGSKTRTKGFLQVTFFLMVVLSSVLCLKSSLRRLHRFLFDISRFRRLFHKIHLECKQALLWIHRRSSICPRLGEDHRKRHYHRKSIQRSGLGDSRMFGYDQACQLS